MKLVKHRGPAHALGVRLLTFAGARASGVALPSDGSAASEDMKVHGLVPVLVLVNPSEHGHKCDDGFAALARAFFSRISSAF
jgi:hypothetical protein